MNKAFLNPETRVGNVPLWLLGCGACEWLRPGYLPCPELQATVLTYVSIAFLFARKTPAGCLTNVVKVKAAVLTEASTELYLERIKLVCGSCSIQIIRGYPLS